MVLLLLNTTKLGGKEYTRNSMNNGKAYLKDLGLKPGFYGGRVKEFGKIKEEKGLFLALDRRDNVIDLFYKKLEDLKIDTLRAICDLKGIEYPETSKKADLIKMIGGE